MTGEGICFLINAISYVFVIASLLMMKVNAKPIIKQNKKVLVELKDGFFYAFGFLPIRHIIFLIGAVSLMGMQYTVLMPVFAKVTLHGGPHTFGFLMGASGMGALAGALYLASRKTVIGLFQLIPAWAGVFGLGLILLSFSHLFWISISLMVIVGLGMMLQMASSNTILQTIVDDDKRGRVMSFYTMAFMGTAPFGSIIAGSLAKVIGTSNTILISGIFCILSAIFFAYKLPELKAAIRPVYVKLGLITDEVTVGIKGVKDFTPHIRP
jgi:MFS family permease